ncbi:MAG: hypothetical protein GC179_18840 [Anaerolineaceae bacterium]|nr:hypothetical protein [Anaerolineaceae bacterium]
MSDWKWLIGYGYSWRFFVRVVSKAFALFAIANLIFAISDPLPFIGRISIYNWLVPGRDRLPYWESNESYNLGLNSIEAMFSSHKISQPKKADEYRVIVVGDSSVWGILLKNSDTLTGNLNKAKIKIGNKTLAAYNIGHPVMSITKDLMLMEYALNYQPDLVVWLVTLEAMPYSKQLDAPLAQNNAVRVRSLIRRFDLKLDVNDTRFVVPDFWGRTIIGQRRPLADWWRLQLYGIDWAATGIDQVNGSYTPRSNDLEADVTWQGFNEKQGFQAGDIAIDVLSAGHKLAGQIPMLVINEPIFVADGRNSNIRYNFWYPKWAYDDYRELMVQTSEHENWKYVDLWDSIAPQNFTDSPVHLNASGSQQLSVLAGQIIHDYVNNKPS